jgi:glycosyltransferase involved in cell wall biosynthesis
MNTIPKNNTNTKTISNLPLVSVIMPAYNAERYIAAALDSVLRQTYRNFEIIIADDASTDKTSRIISYYQSRYPEKITVVRLKKNRNCGGDIAANEAVKLAKGDYLVRMDADDIALPSRFEKQVKFLKANPGIFLVGSNAYVIDEHDTVIGEKKNPLHTTKSAHSSLPCIRSFIRPRCSDAHVQTAGRSGMPFASMRIMITTLSSAYCVKATASPICRKNCSITVSTGKA